MERLTGSSEEIKTLTVENEEYWLKVYFKLKEYEDLEEHLEKVYGEHDGLLETVIKSLVKYNGEKPRKSRLLTDEDADKWEMYKDAEEQGVLVKFPCKIGDILYYISKGGIKGLIVREIRIREHYTDVLTEDISGEKYAFLSGVIGKVVFLTREEAEAALERMW